LELNFSSHIGHHAGMHGGLANHRVITIGVNTIDLMIRLGAIFGADSGIFSSDFSIKFGPSSCSVTFDAED